MAFRNYSLLHKCKSSNLRFSGKFWHFPPDLPSNTMEIISGLENSISLVLILSSIIVAVFLVSLIRRFMSPSEIPQIHPESEQTVNEVRQSRATRNRCTSNGDSAPSSNIAEVDDCPICLEDLKFAVETNCRHRFCGECFYAYWQRFPPLSQPNCPVCRSQLRFLLKRFTPTDMDTGDPAERSEVESRVAVFNRRFSGNPVSLMDQIRDLPVLLRYCWRVMFEGEAGISCLLRLRLIVLFLFVFFYVISPLDIFPESIVGVFGLLDDCLVCLVFFIYVAALFRGHLIADA